ncbi:MAG: methyltransferase domain-containing protein [Actinomycetota bacterium]|nr:methyltransferase domain-containing protein [Actinomycetota bacterium]
MIVTTEELKGLRGKVAMVDGSFDPFHDGHVAYFRSAAELGFPVFVNIASEAWTSSKHLTLLPLDRRIRVIDAIEGVDYVHSAPMTTAEVLRELQPAIYVKGADWRERGLPEDEQQLCKELGIEIAYTETALNSSSALLRSALFGQFAYDELDRFEEFMRDQKSPADSDFDNDYFLAEWRKGDNSYNLEQRRAIEGKHPAVLIEAFQPKNVLDAGCGPGALMTLLDELGVEAHGVDVSPNIHEFAEAAVKDRIIVASIDDMPYEDNTFDLVVSREVLEHIPVRDYLKVVQELCRVSGKYVYVTTRFHPSPASLFDVTTEFEADPTHISLTAQPFLRMLFVLAGMRRRKDLESQMDWMDKRRVLVYEKPRDE